MSEKADFKTWAIVEVMGHNEYAGFVSTELIAGMPMLRVDVPETSRLSAFTKFLSPGAIYGITPCSEETAKARAESKPATPFQCWDVEREVMNDLRRKGMLIEHKEEACTSPACETCDGNGWVDDPSDGGTMCCPECES